MKLIRFADWRTGIVVELSTGPHVLDVVASVGALLPHDSLSNGLLNGILRDRGSWAPLIEHWPRVRAGLTRLAQCASLNPDHLHLIMRPLQAAHVSLPPIDCKSIAALEVIEWEDVRRPDPTGRASIAAQFPAVPLASPTADERGDLGPRDTSLNVVTFSKAVHRLK
jgi:hypothetical protein